MEYFSRSSFGQLLLSLFSSCFSRPSLLNFLMLAKGWCLSSSQHTITTYLRLSGGAKNKHFSRYYAFFSTSFYRETEELWRRLLLFCASFVDAHQAIRIQIDDATRKKSGRCIQGASFYRNGAGSARQEYRNLWGLNWAAPRWVWISMSIPLKKYPPHCLTIPVGLRLYLKEPVAKALNRPYYSRSQLARKMLDMLASTLASYRLMVTADGGYTTKEFLGELPANVVVVGRFSISSKLYRLPGPRAKSKKGPKPKKGSLIGTAKTLAAKKKGWRACGQQTNTCMQSLKGIWHSKLPGVGLHVVMLKRASAQEHHKQLEAFFCTDASMDAEEILTEYSWRWAVEISIRDSNAFYGFGHDQCRNIHCIIGVNTFRAILAACRTLWFIRQLDTKPVNLLNGRPWYSKKCHPSQADVCWMFREVLACEAITPTPSFFEDMHLLQTQLDPVFKNSA